MNRYFAPTLAILMGVSAPVLAQDATQWAGAYAGLIATSNNGHQVYDSSPEYDLKSKDVGAILGYNFATGPWVMGGELAYSNGLGAELGFPNFHYKSVLDLKARAGYAMNNVLFYGTVGGSHTKWDEGGGTSFGGSGTLYGLGVDYLVSPRFFVGLEYVRRDMKSDWTTAGDKFDATINSVSLRAAMKF